ncbi:hypothetical protein LTS10_012607 [Elasticomyces elasticus]|nr:hypothetical protein LTS10_012607 [Elasticomyces elasticus]
MSEELVLYDLPSQQGRCWNMNVWKVSSARLSLNYKGLPYRTEWTEYPDLNNKLSSLGCPPNPPGTNYVDYSSPAARFPDGTFVMDSLRIAHALEKLQPEPSLHLDNGYVDRVFKTIMATHGALAPNAVVRLPIKVLRPASQEYFRTTRGKRFGMSLEELAKSDKAGETAWKAAELHLNELKAILAEHSDGPYVMGKTVSFADFIIAGYWRMLQILDEGGDLYDRMMKVDASFPTHHEACKQWLEKDD